VLCDDRAGAVPRQQLCDAVDGVLGDALEHVAQPGFRIEAVQQGGRDQRGDASRASSPAVGAGEQPVLSVMQTCT
jgi:hypothetical protein